jgi:hypothetical protein
MSMESIMLIVFVLCFCGVHHDHCFCLVFLWSPSCSQWAWWTPQKHRTETMNMMNSTKTQDRNNEHDGPLFLSRVFVESIMPIVSVLCFCGIHHAHCFCLVFLWSPSCSLVLSCVFVESIMLTMSMMNYTKTQDRNNEHDELHKNTKQNMLIVSVLCFCGVHHAHCFCLVFLWSSWCSLFLSCVFVESIMLIVSVLCFCGTQDRNNEHDELHKNIRQKQWAWWTPKNHIMLIVSVLCFCGVHHAHCFCLVFLWSPSWSL